MAWKQRLIDEKYDGNTQRFESDFANAVAQGRLHAVQWNDLLTDATTLPHVKDAGQELIKINLGYLPPADVVMPFEPYLRALIQTYCQGAVLEDDFYRQLEGHVKLIRNADMRHNLCLDYDDAIYQDYHLNFSHYGYKARERISRLLGYEPDLRHSLMAELWMRDILSDDTYKIPEEITSDDVRAITLVKYRETLLLEGQQAADAASLWGWIAKT
jgi:hypothetical protein